MSIPRLMKLAGLTHGGFDNHFRDRDDLVARAIAHAAGSSMLAGDTPAAGAFEAYLSKDHLSHPECGCVVAALGAEGARQEALAHGWNAHAVEHLSSLWRSLRASSLTREAASRLAAGDAIERIGGEKPLTFERFLREQREDFAAVAPARPLELAG